MPTDINLLLFSLFTVQLGPSFLIRLLRAASPGGNNAQPDGILSTLPSKVSTLLGSPHVLTSNVCAASFILVTDSFLSQLSRCGQKLLQLASRVGAETA